MKKKEAYEKLVEKRKVCSLCRGLRNPATVANGRHDLDQIGPWSLWQANLNAKIVVVGQDWGDVSYFVKWEGKDQPSGNPTNENLQKLLKTIDIEIGKPREQQDQIIFLTNLILCLKTGGLQGRVDNQWFKNCSYTFFKPLIEIISPRIVIALGKRPAESILALYSIPYSKSAPFSHMIKRSPFAISATTWLFPVYHCGAGSTNRNRSMSEQQGDWLRIGRWLQNDDFR